MFKQNGKPMANYSVTGRTHTSKCAEGAGSRFYFNPTGNLTDPGACRLALLHAAALLLPARGDAVGRTPLRGLCCSTGPALPDMAARPEPPCARRQPAVVGRWSHEQDRRPPGQR